MKYYQYNSFREYVAALNGHDMKVIVHEHAQRQGFTPAVVILIESTSVAYDMKEQLVEWAKEVCQGRFYAFWDTDWWFENEDDAMMYKLRWQ